MSKLDVTVALDDANAVVPPIVLLIGTAHDLQNYLTPDNRVLEALYGIAPVRLCIEMSPECMAYMKSGPDWDLEIVRARPNMSLTQVRSLSVDELGGFLGDALDVLIHDECGSIENPIEFRQMMVKVVIVGTHLVITNQDRQIMRSALEYLENAVIFAAEFPRGLPVLLENSRPHCAVCGTLMRAAGAAFVCEGCGATA